MHVAAVGAKEVAHHLVRNFVDVDEEKERSSRFALLLPTCTAQLFGRGRTKHEVVPVPMQKRDARLNGHLTWALQSIFTAKSDVENCRLLQRGGAKTMVQLTNLFEIVHGDVADAVSRRELVRLVEQVCLMRRHQQLI